ncbi:aspartic peptidase domain-containing protein [Xylaria flabelliformis]|nr:aspartic peptidase domain-containing protein [Xylaria flabelliformis]
MLPPNSIGWRVFALLGVLFSAFATGVVGSNATYTAGETTIDNSKPLKHPGQVITIPLKRVNHRGIATPSIAKRLFKTEIFGVYGAAYLAELTIGNNGQVVNLLIDTGSFEMWVNPNCSTSNVPEYCQAFGHYDPSLSPTSQRVDSAGFSIKYGSGQAKGPYYKDDIYISGTRIQNQQFGVANSSELVWFGIMGLGHGDNGFISYPLVVESLETQGHTNTRLFSINLGRQASPGAVITGELTFGGVDTNSYAGLLQKVPTDPSDPHYKIILNGLAHRAPGADSSTSLVDSSLPLPLIVDSGTTLSLLPESLVTKLAAQFPGATSDGAGGYHVDCAYQNQTGTVDFEILTETGTVTINIAYRDFIWNNGGDCLLGAWFSNDVGTFILGDSFMRGAYVAFDQTNRALFMSNRLSCGDDQLNIVAVSDEPDAAANIPGSCAVVLDASPAPPSSTTTSSTTASTTTSTTASTTSLTTSSTTTSTTTSTTASTTGSTTDSTTALTTSSTTSSTIASTTGSTTGSTTSSTIASTTGSTTGSTTASTTASTTDSTTNSITGSTTGSITDTITVTLSIPSSSQPLAPSSPGTPSSVSTSTTSATSQLTSISSPTTSPRPNINTGGQGTDGERAGITHSPTIGTDADPNASPTLHRDPGGFMSTVTGTITRTVMYTVTACPETVKDCPLRGKVATRLETILTTYCPDRDEIPSLTPVGGVTFVQELNAPVFTSPIVEIETGIAGPSPGHGQGADEAEQITVITTAYPTTTAYAVKSCSQGDAACTVGMTTTHAITTTLVKTVHVEPIPASIPPGNGFASAVTSSYRNTTWNSGGGGGGPNVAVSAGSDTIFGIENLVAALVLVWGVMAML